MMAGISANYGMRSISYEPSDVVDLPAAQVQARMQVAALKNQQDMLLMQGQEMARMMEPHKGTLVDRYA